MTNPRIKAIDLELKNEVIAVKRVTKVVEGGRRFRFTAIVIVGNGEGVVGYGIGKARDVSQAVKKAVEAARKNLVKVPLRSETLWHEVTGKFKSGRVFLCPAAPGTGVVAGSATRVIAKLAGIKNLLAKSKGSCNPHNMVKATFQAFSQLNDPGMVAKRRGISLQKVFNG